MSDQTPNTWHYQDYQISIAEMECIDDETLDLSVYSESEYA